MLLAEPPRSQGDLNFVLFGIPVRVHPFFWLVSLLFGLRGTEGDPKLMLIWVAAVFLCILAHELGHAFAARAYGWRPHITLHGMGGLASYQPTYHDPRRQILISLAGPGAGFALAILMAAVFRAAGHGILFHLGRPYGVELFVRDIANANLNALVNYMMYINLFWGLVNLLPVYPLDGGHIAREVLNIFNPRESIRQSLWLSVFTGIAIALYGWIQLKDPYIAVFFGYLAFSSFQTLQAYFGTGGGYGGRR